MLRVLWFAVKVGLIVAASVWVANRPGVVTINWLGYTIRSQAWVTLLAGLLALMIILALHRFLLGVLGFPGAWRRYREYRQNQKGQRALMLGLAAVAAGDRKMAQYQTHRARHFLPRDSGLTLLLEADTARLRGDDAAARDSYKRLMADRDMAFLGMRGLLSTALDTGQADEALAFARQALTMHPKQPWLLRLVYRLELRERRWEDALRTLRRVEKVKAVPAEIAIRDRQALLLQQAQESFDNAQDRTGFEKLKLAYRIDPAFVPAALRLAERYMETGQRRVAVKIISKSWALSPHPELAHLWNELAPSSKSGDVSARLRWFERLVALRPDSVESQLAAARAAIDDRLWGEARQYLSMAESIRPTATLYRLRALMEEQLSHPNEARHWLNKAAEAPADYVWTCRETGQIYERWSAIAEPHGAFNTIVWDYPRPRQSGSLLQLPSEQPEMTLLPRLRA